MGVEERLHQRQAGAHRVDVPGGERDRLGGGFPRHGAVLAQSGGRHKVPLRQIDGFPHPAGRARLGCPDLSPVVTRETVMPMHLEGSCRCGAVTFALDSHTPVPYQLCYCSICRKTAGSGGYAINLGGIAASLKLKGKRSTGLYQAVICEDDGSNCVTSSGQRHFCKKCATALWLYEIGRASCRERVCQYV